MTASAGGFVSNQVAVYSHPPITSLSVAGPQKFDRAADMPPLKAKLRNLDATAAYCASTG